MIRVQFSTKWSRKALWRYFLGQATAKEYRDAVAYFEQRRQEYYQYGDAFVRLVPPNDQNQIRDAGRTNGLGSGSDPATARLLRSLRDG